MKKCSFWMVVGRMRYVRPAAGRSSESASNSRIPEVGQAVTRILNQGGAMSYLQPYLPILMILVLACLFGVGTLVASSLIGPRRPNRAKYQAYECGIEPTGEANVRITVKYYIVALLFLLFDMETVLIIAWAIAFRDPTYAGFQVYAFFVMVFFLLILVVGFLYEWRKGALEWN
jgi:NADH-quinone oxidoreductase subunit A